MKSFVFKNCLTSLQEIIKYKDWALGTYELQTQNQLSVLYSLLIVQGSSYGQLQVSPSSFSQEYSSLWLLLAKLPSKSKFEQSKTCSSISIICIPPPLAISNVFWHAEIFLFGNPHKFLVYFKFLASTNLEFSSFKFFMVTPKLTFSFASILF